MRVAVVINTSWNIYNFRLGLIKSMLQRGHEVACIAPRDSFSNKLVEEGCEFYPITMDSRGVNPLKDLALIWELRKQYKKVKPDIILHYTVKPNIYGTFAAYLLNIPVINNVCGLGSSFIRGGLVSGIVKLLYKLSFRYARKVFFQNNEDCDLFISQNIVKKEMADLVPGSGINIEHFQPGINDKNDKFTFLMISRLIKDKGVFEFVNAVKQLKEMKPHARFQLLGQIDSHSTHGIPAEIVKKWVNDGIVEYLGTTHDVRDHIEKADCIVLPSYREGTPRTLLEASSMAKPIIATQTPGCRHVVEDNETGLLCEVKSAADLANKMNTMYSMSDSQRKTMGQNGRIKIEREYNEEIVISKYCNSIQQILSLN